MRRFGALVGCVSWVGWALLAACGAGGASSSAVDAGEGGAPGEASAGACACASPPEVRCPAGMGVVVVTGSDNYCDIPDSSLFGLCCSPCDGRIDESGYCHTASQEACTARGGTCASGATCLPGTTADSEPCFGATSPCCVPSDAGDAGDADANDGG